jgi:DNA-binding MarR family transcriptional regulator
MTKVKSEKAKRGNNPENLALRPETFAAADRLHSAAIHLLRRVRQQDVNSGVGPAQLSALSVLVFAGPKTLGALAAAEQVKAPTMSRIVAGLKRRRLVETTRDPHDTRCMHIRATAKGTHLLQQARLRRIESLASLLTPVTSADIAKLNQAVAILKTLLET